MSTNIDANVKAKKSRKRERALARRLALDPRLTGLVEIASSWYYWEQDENFRFTLLTGSMFQRAGIDPRIYVGKARWELDMVPVDEGGWERHRTLLEAHLPFTDALFKTVNPHGKVRYIRTTGQPTFDDRGRFTGYRGITRDVTRRLRAEQRQAIEHDVAEVLAQSDNVEKALAKILEVISDKADWACGAYWELNGETNTLHCKHTRVKIDDVQEFVAATLALSPCDAQSGSLLANVCSSGEPVWISDITSETSFLRADIAKKAGLRCLLAFPIKRGGNIAGVFEFYSPEALELDAELLKTATRLSRNISQFCQRKKDEEDLLRFRTATDMSPDAIFLVDHATLRYVDFNETGCARSGYTREELLQRGPADSLRMDREQVRHDYDHVIAKYPASVCFERYAYDRIGRKAICEMHHRALLVGGKWYIITVSRHIHERKQAERAMQRLSRMYTVLSATNEALLRTTSPESLFQQVCDAAVETGMFVTASIMVPNPATGEMQLVASAGSTAHSLRDAKISVDKSLPEGRGLVGTAYRSKAPAVTDDFLIDRRLTPWHETARACGWASGAAIPLIRHNQAVGVLSLLSSKRRTFDAEVIKLLERMAENLTFALDNLDLDAQRRTAEAAHERFARLYRALSITNETIIRARSVEELYQGVCDATLQGGNFIASSAFIVEPDGQWAHAIANAGAGAEKRSRWRASLDHSRPDGRGVLSTAFHTGKSCISNDYLNDERAQYWRETARESRVGSIAAIPVRNGDRVRSVVILYSRETNAFDDDAVRLLERVADNVAYAHTNLDSETERQRADAAKQRVAHMYAALSATNEAILRAKSPEELYQRVCEAAVQGGKLVTATVLLPDAIERRAKPVAIAGLGKRNVNAAHLSLEPDSPDAASMAVTALRTAEVSVSNDYANDPRTSHWHENARRIGFNACAAVPLMRNGQASGALLFYSKERHVFDDDVIGLLKRMAENICFALENFDREESRRHAEHALRASEEKHRNILESIDDAYYEVDLKGNFVFFNPALCRMLGYSHDELLGMNNREYTTPEMAARVYEAYNQVYRSGTPNHSLDWVMRRKDGRHVYAEGSVYLVKDPHDNPIGFRGIVRDITRRRREEQLLALEHTVTRQLAEGHSTRQALSAVVQSMCQSAGWHNGSYWALNAETNAFTLLAGWTASNTAVAAQMAKRYENAIGKSASAEGLLGHMLETGQHIWIPDIMGEAPAGIPPHRLAVWRRRLPTSEERSALFFPVFADGKIIGALVFASYDIKEPDERLLQTARVIGTQVGQFFQRRHAEHVLRESEAKHRSILENMGDGYWETDLRGSFTYVNEAMSRHMGYGRDELRGLNYATYYDEENRKRVFETFHSVYRTRTREEGTDLNFIRKDGSPGSFETSVDLILDNESNPIGFRGVSRFTTERKKAEAALRVSEEKYRTIVETIHDAYYEVDLKGNFVFFNTAFSRMLGYSPEELTGMNNRVYTTPEIAKQVYQAYNEVYRTGAPKNVIESEMRRKDGKVIYVEGSVQLVKNSQDEPIGFRGIVRDVTQRRQEERLLALEHAVTRNLAEGQKVRRTLRAVLRTIAESTSWRTGGYWSFDEAAQTFTLEVGWNSTEADRAVEPYRAPQQLVLTAEGVLGAVTEAEKAIWIPDVMQKHPHISEKRLQRWRDRFAVTQDRSMFMFPVHADGKIIGVITFSAVEIKEPDARLIQTMRVIGDQVAHFLQRRSAERVLRQSEEKYRSVLENMSDGYWETDLRGNYTHFNDAMCSGMGYPRDVLMGMNYRKYYPPEEIKRVRETYGRVYNTRTREHGVEFQFIRGDGSPGWFEPSIDLIFDNNGKPVGFRGVTRFTTERKKAEAALRASEEKYRTIIETIHDAYYENDYKGNLIFFNSAFCRMLGYAAEELHGLNYRAYIAPESVKMMYEEYSKAFRTGVPNNALVTQMLRKDGTVIHGEGSVELITNARGEPIGFRGIVRDVTKRRHEEQMLALEHAVTRHLAEGKKVRPTLHAVLRAIGEATSWQQGGYFGYDEQTDTFALVVGWAGEEAPPDVVKYYNDKPRLTMPADGLIGLACETRRALWVPDIAQDMPHIPKERLERTRQRAIDKHELAHLMFPVFAGGKAIGVLSFANREIKEPDERLLQTTRVIGNQIGQFLQRKQAEAVLRESEARFRALTELSSDWYWELDEHNRFKRFEGRLVHEHPHFFKPFIGRRPWEFLGREGNGVEEHRQTIEQRKPFRDHVSWRTTKSGKRVYFSASGEPVFDAQGKFLGYRGIGKDVTEQKLAEERIQYLATHDALTDLPNRVMFNQILGVSLQTARRFERKLAVLFIDLDRFKVINDTLGHAAGDKLLQETALRLQHTLRTGDVIARLGGDEFVVLVQDMTDADQIAAVARKILSALIRPVQLGEQEYRVTGSIGIAMFPDDAQDEASLMKSADMAMYLAKDEGKNNFQFYSQNIQKRSLERLALETNMRRALEQDQFSLNYQAKLDLQTGRITGVEALLRWQSPVLGSVSPVQFIPLAEETGLIVPIGKWVLRTACEQSIAWQRAGLPPVCMAVNLSARQFADENLLSDIATVLRDTGLKPELLELEITEGMVMQNPERAAQILNAIKDMGVRLAIDDFGTGYSSLAQIKRFPLDTLKVDRSFIRDIPGDAEDRAITEAIIAMAKTLQLTVVAEGVETREQAEFLRSLSCDEMQGYYFSKPVAAEHFATLLREHTPLRH